MLQTRPLLHKRDRTTGPRTGILVLLVLSFLISLVFFQFYFSPQCLRKKEQLEFKVELIWTILFLEVNKEIILCPALFIFVLKTLRVLIWLGSIKETKYRHHRLQAGTTNMLHIYSPFLFHLHSEKKIAVNFPWTRLPLMARPRVDPAESAGTWYYPTHYTAQAIRLQGAQQYTPHESNFSATMQ